MIKINVKWISGMAPITGSKSNWSQSNWSQWIGTRKVGSSSAEHLFIIFRHVICMQYKQIFSLEKNRHIKTARSIEFSMHEVVIWFWRPPLCHQTFKPWPNLVWNHSLESRYPNCYSMNIFPFLFDTFTFQSF